MRPQSQNKQVTQSARTRAIKARWVAVNVSNKTFAQSGYQVYVEGNTDRGDFASL